MSAAPRVPFFEARGGPDAYNTLNPREICPVIAFKELFFCCKSFIYLCLRFALSDLHKKTLELYTKTIRGPIYKIVLNNIFEPLKVKDPAGLPNVYI